MSKAEKFISDCTRNCSNVIIDYQVVYNGVPQAIYKEWLTPDQARKAVEIAREEMIDKVCKYLDLHCDEVKTEDNGIAGCIDNEFINNFKQAMKDDKAEDRAKERYWLEPSNIETQEKYAAYVEGYHQAEKDLELTWEDMRELHIIFADIDVDIELCKTNIKAETLGYYQEVLKQFKKKKGK